MIGGLEFIVIDAQKQARTARDVKGPWVRPKVPAKAKGRWGTRRMWKRRNPPHWMMFYREPDDVLILHGRTAFVTPRQFQQIKRCRPTMPA